VRQLEACLVTFHSHTIFQFSSFLPHFQFWFRTLFDLLASSKQIHSQHSKTSSRYSTILLYKGVTLPFGAHEHHSKYVPIPSQPEFLLRYNTAHSAKPSASCFLCNILLYGKSSPILLYFCRNGFSVSVRQPFVQTDSWLTYTTQTTAHLPVVLYADDC